jgi:hypothetical protein
MMETPKEWLGLGWDAWGAIATVSTGLMAIVAAFLTIWATGRADRRKTTEQVYGVAMRVVAALDGLRSELKEIENDVIEELEAKAREMVMKRKHLRKEVNFSAHKYTFTDIWMNSLLITEISVLGLGATTLFILIISVLREFQEQALESGQVLRRLARIYKLIDELRSLSEKRLPQHLRS